MTETEDIYKDMAERPEIFDLNNSKVIGLFKDECPNNPRILPMTPSSMSSKSSTY
ncbi:10421_t:CDS:2 [Entrophospora sp. SA101]|nr:10421_t:CDS:2 [Entrophospora sp. SA101]